MTSNPPTKWGPIAWRKFHIKAITFPGTPCICDIDQIVRFYQEVFPKYIHCESCATHYRRILRENPIEANSMIDLFKWTVDVHNRINNKMGKRSVSYADSYDYWLDVVNETYGDYGFFCQCIDNPFIYYDSDCC